MVTIRTALAAMLGLAGLSAVVHAQQEDTARELAPGVILEVELGGKSDPVALERVSGVDGWVLVWADSAEADLTLELIRRTRHSHATSKAAAGEKAARVLVEASAGERLEISLTSDSAGAARVCLHEIAPGEEEQLALEVTQRAIEVYDEALRPGAPEELREEATRLAAEAIEARPPEPGFLYAIVLGDLVDAALSAKDRPLVGAAVAIGVPVYETLLSPLDSLRHNATFLLADSFRNAGRLEPALDLLRRHLSFLPSGERPGLATLQTRNEIGLTLVKLGQRSLAQEELYAVVEEATARRREGSAVDAAWWHNLGSVLYEQGDLVGAQLQYETVLELRPKEWLENTSEGLKLEGNLAMILAELGDLRRALAIQERVLEGLERRLGPDDDDVVRARHSILITEARLSGGLKSLDEIAKILDFRRQTLGEHHPDTWRALEDYGMALHRAGRSEEALQALSEVLARSEDRLPSEHNVVLWALDSIAVLHMNARRWSDAWPFVSRGLDRIRAAIPTTLEVSPRERLARLRHLARFTIRFTGIAFSGPELSGLEERAIGTLECLRLASVARYASDPERENEEIRTLRARTAAARASVSELVLASGATEAEADVSVRLREAVSSREEAERSLCKALYRRGLSTYREIDFAEVASVLPPRSAIVGYRDMSAGKFLPQDLSARRAVSDLAAYVVSPDQGLALPDLVSRDEIAASIRRWRVAIGEPLPGDEARRDSAQEREAGARLRELVLDPILAAVGGIDRLYVCKDDLLHLVPLDALPLGDGVVGDAIEVRELSSFAGVLERGSRRTRLPSPLLMGDVDYGSPAAGPSRYFEPLRQSRREIEVIAAGFSTSTGREALVLLGSEASKEALLEFSREATHLHVATHGYYEQRQQDVPETRSTDPFAWSSERAISAFAPLALCGLALAGANLDPDPRGAFPGRITAEELAGLDLSGCEVAVLAACETGVGMWRAGQGTWSLHAALHLAGARASVTTLWEVGDDEYTVALLKGFYDRMWEGASPATALREAKRTMRERRRPTREWAAWSLVGDATGD